MQRLWALVAAVVLVLSSPGFAQSDLVKQVIVDGVSLDCRQVGATVRVPEVTDTTWWYGCSCTSAGMMIGHYDRTGYGSDPLHNKYPNLVPGGVAELDAYGSNGPLVKGATASAGHIADFYRGAYNTSGDDVAQPWHTFDCLADFMGTNQDAYGNVNGATTFWNYTNGTRMYASTIYSYGVSYYGSDGMFGLWEYVNHCGYGSGSPDANFFSQYIYGYNGNTLGFTWAQFVAEIDAGRPVIIQVEGHSMLAYGYDNTGGAQTVLLHDTWSQGEHTMTWGGSYSGLQHYGVVCATLTNGVPEPASLTLLALAALGLRRRALAIRRRRG